MMRTSGAQPSTFLSAGLSGRRTVTVAAILAVAVTSTCFAAGPTAAEVVARARKASDAHSYMGVRRVEARQGNHTLIIRQKVYRAPGGHERFEIVSPASMAGNLATLDGRTHWRYYPNRHEASRTRATFRGSDPLAADLFNSGGRMRLALGGNVTLAGRPCYTLNVSDASGKRRLTAFVDTATCILFGVDRLRPNGGLVDSWRFESVKFVKSLDHALFTFRPPAGTRVLGQSTQTTRVRLNEAARSLGMQPLLPTRLPEGYRLLQERVTVVRRGRHEALWMPFTNGVETFSIFQSRSLPRTTRPGAHAVRWDVDGYTLLVVGHLNEAELSALKGSLPRLTTGS
jgi:outer membrane lipoprotein-sorting protein